MVPTGEVHPAAAIFPMLPDDELADLAADIQQNGLIHPLVLDQDGRLVDGRNRLAACRLAGIEPVYTSLNGADPVAYIMSTNWNRRHLNSGQRAVAVVLVDRFNLKQSSQRQLSAQHSINPARIGQASIIIEYRPDLAEAVMAGTQRFDSAYELAKTRKAETEGEAARLKNDAIRLSILREQAPDLAALVEEDRQSLAEAWLIWQKREADALGHRKATSKHFHESAAMLDTVLLVHDPAQFVRDWIPGDYFIDVQSARDVKTAAGLRVLADRLLALAEVLDENGGKLA